MEELLRTIVSQNERLLSVLDRMADKLEVLDEVEDGIRSLESSVLGALPSVLEVDLDRIVSSLSEVVEELQCRAPDMLLTPPGSETASLI